MGYFRAHKTMYRVLVYFKSDLNKKPVKAEFKQCVLDHFGVKNETKVHCELNGLKFVLSSEESGDTAKPSVILKHPPFCPIHHLPPEEFEKLPETISLRGIDVGVVILLQTLDDRLLLTQRASHLRTFPSVWVPPGGHMENGENLLQAGLRELKEETGLHFKDEYLESKILALWESVFPPVLSHGSPTRHHIVVYFLCKIVKEHQSLEHLISMDWNEVEACAWLSRNLIRTLVNLNQGNLEARSQLPETFLATVIENHDQLQKEISTSVLIGEVSKDKVGRISTGTYFALSEWLKETSQ